MKKLIYIIGSVVVLILLLVIILFFWFSTVENREIKNGQKENEVIYKLDNIKEPLDIVYLGDSITTGVLSSSNLSASDIGYRDNINDILMEAELLSSSINYSVPGFTSLDTLQQLSDDLNLNDTNKLISLTDDYTDSDDNLENLYPVDQQNSPTISDSIISADVVYVTLGANDILSNISITDSGMRIDFKGLKNSIVNLKTNKDIIYTKIHELNPKVKIFDIGIYFAFPHIGDLMHKLYPILVIAEQFMFIDDPNQLIYNVVIRDNMQPNILNLVDNSNDVHPTVEGYEIITNEILKATNEAFE